MDFSNKKYSKYYTAILYEKIKYFTTDKFAKSH